MKQFAFVNEENIVGSIIVSESMETLSEIPGGSEGIELPDGHSVGTGYIYNPTDNTFTKPVEEGESE
jgi:hypothetical protein